MKFLDTYNKIDKYDEQRARFKGYLYASLFILLLSVIIPFNTLLIPYFPPRIKKYLVPYVPFWNNFVQTTSQILVSVSTSATAACFIEIASGMREVWKKEEKQKKFRELFGFEDGDNIAIVIPRFPMERLDTLSNDAKNEIFNLNLAPTAVQSLKSDTNFLGEVDVKAAISVLIEFEKQKLDSLPLIKMDDEILDSWIAGNLEFKTLIIIGLFSNRFSMYYSNNIPELFKLEQVALDSPSIVKIQKRIGIGREKRLSSLSSSSPSEAPYIYAKNGVADFEYDFYFLAIAKLLYNQYFRLLDFYFHTLIQQRQKNQPTKDYPYGLLAKIRPASYPEKVLFFLGGMRAKETEEIAKYLCNNWDKKIYKYTDLEIETEVKENDFVMWINLNESIIERAIVNKK